MLKENEDEIDAVIRFNSDHTHGAGVDDGNENGEACLLSEALETHYGGWNS